MYSRPMDNRTRAARKSTPSAVDGVRHVSSERKEEYRMQLLQELGAGSMTRRAMARMLGISRQTLYKHFSPYELDEIEVAARG